MSISVSSLSSLLRSSTAGSTIKGKPSQNRLDSTDGVWFIYKLGQIHLETTTIKQKGRTGHYLTYYKVACQNDEKDISQFLQISLKINVVAVSWQMDMI